MSVGILHGFAVEKKTNSPTACNCSDRPFRSASRSWQLSMTSRMLWHRLTVTFLYTSTARDIAARYRVTVESVVSINYTVLRKQLKTEDLRRLFGVRAFNKRWPSWSVDSSWLRSLCTWSALRFLDCFGISFEFWGDHSYPGTSASSSARREAISALKLTKVTDALRSLMSKV